MSQVSTTEFMYGKLTSYDINPNKINAREN